MGYTDLDQLAINIIHRLVVYLLLLFFLLAYYLVYCLPRSSFFERAFSVCRARGRGNETLICSTADKPNLVSFAPALGGLFGTANLFFVALPVAIKGCIFTALLYNYCNFFPNNIPG